MERRRNRASPSPSTFQFHNFCQASRTECSMAMKEAWNSGTDWEQCPKRRVSDVVPYHGHGRSFDIMQSAGFLPSISPAPDQRTSHSFQSGGNSAPLPGTRNLDHWSRAFSRQGSRACAHSLLRRWILRLSILQPFVMAPSAESPLHSSQLCVNAEERTLKGDFPAKRRREKAGFIGLFHPSRLCCVRSQNLL